LLIWLLEEKALQNVAQRMVEQMHEMLIPKLSEIYQLYIIYNVIKSFGIKKLIFYLITYNVLKLLT